MSSDGLGGLGCWPATPRVELVGIARGAEPWASLIVIAPRCLTDSALRAHQDSAGGGGPAAWAHREAVTRPAGTRCMRCNNCNNIDDCVFGYSEYVGPEQS